MKKLISSLRRARAIVSGDAVVLTVKDDKLIVDAGTRTPEEVKNLAATFFKAAYKLI